MKKIMINKKDYDFIRKKLVTKKVKHYSFFSIRIIP